MKLIYILVTTICFCIANYTELIAQADTTPPQIISLTVSPQIIDVSSSEAMVTVTMELSDDLSGIWLPDQAITFPNGYTSWIRSSRISGNSLNVTWQGVFNISQYVGSGTAFVSLLLCDSLSNCTTISTADLIAAGFDPEFEVVGSQQIDTTPPQIISLTVSPQIVDVSSSEATVTVTMELSDNLSGVWLPDQAITFPNGYTSWIRSSRISGNSLNGTWQGVFNISQYVGSGPAFVSLLLCDSLSNCISISTADLIATGFDPEFEIINSPLPIRLINFVGRLREENVELSWVTEFEVNNKGFELEHSIYIEGWHKLCFIEGQNTFSQKSTYNYIHTSPEAGINYYRLKQIDIDGKYEYSNIIFIKNTNKSDLLIYPNPVGNELYVKGGIENFHYTIKNAHGQIVQTGQLEDKQSINTVSLKSGLYYLSIENEIFKFVKQ